MAVVIAGSAWVLRLPSGLRQIVPRCGEVWLPSKQVRRQHLALEGRTGKKIRLNSALPERTEKKRLPLEEGQRQPSGPRDMGQCHPQGRS